MVEKPASVAASPFKSAKWDELTNGRDFRPSDAPALALLCQWYAIAEQCMDDVDYDGEVRVAYSNDLGDIKPMPQIATMKQASAEIRALNKQLGINDEAPAQPRNEPRAVIIDVITQKRRAKAQDRRGAAAS